MSAPRITIHIDRIVLRGVEAHQSKAIVEGLRAELTALYSDPAARQAAGLRSTGVLRLGRLPLGPGRAGGLRFGAAVARATQRGLRP